MIDLINNNMTLGSFWMPPKAADVAHQSDPLWYFIYYVSMISFVAIIALMVVFIIKYRRRPGHEATQTVTHSTALELCWSVPPFLIVMVIFVWGLTGFMDMQGEKANVLDIKVYARQWVWEFEYPGGLTTSELHLPVNRPVRLTLTSNDVIHSVWIPAFRIKRDAVPGRYNKVTFTPLITTQQNNNSPYPLLCTEYCGTEHSSMLTVVYVYEQDEYAQWYKDARRSALDELNDEQYAIWQGLKTEEQVKDFVKEIAGDNAELIQVLNKLNPPSVIGEGLYNKKGCVQCHRIDGERSTGPAFNGLWGKERLYKEDGAIKKVIADENYIRESIVDPQAKIVETYQGVMTPYRGKLSDRQIDAIIAYIRSLDE